MKSYIALLRGINVGGNNKVAMQDLRDFARELGFENPRTVLQSGNLVFRAESIPTDEIEKMFEEKVEERLKVKVEFMVRDAGELVKIIKANPYPAEARKEPSWLVVTFLKKPVDPSRVTELLSGYEGPEKAEAKGRELYIFYPEGIGRSKLGTTLTDAKLGSRGTARNWNTVLKLDALASE